MLRFFRTRLTTIACSPRDVNDPPNCGINGGRAANIFHFGSNGFADYSNGRWTNIKNRLLKK